VLASIDDVHIACFGRLASERFAQPLADATVLPECLEKWSGSIPGSTSTAVSQCHNSQLTDFVIF
jgi:hypothetical protein